MRSIKIRHQKTDSFDRLRPGLKLRPKMGLSTVGQRAGSESPELVGQNREKQMQNKIMDNDRWWWMMIYDDGNSIYFKISDQIRNKYEKHAWMVLIHPHRIVIEKTTRSSPKTKQSGHSQRSSVRTYKVHQDHQDHQGQTKHHKTPAFRMVQRYMAQLHGSTMTVTMVHLSRAPSHRNRHVKHRRERVPPESICRLHSGTGGIFLSTSVHAAVQFNFLRCSRPGKKRSTARMVKVILWLPVMPCGSNQLIFSTPLCFELRH